jgi:DNA-binding IclR family transcriptional regulator
LVNGSSPVQGSQTLARGLRTIALIADSPDGLTGTEVSRALGVHQSIAYRLLQTLVQFDVVRKDLDNHYRVGLSMISLAESATGGLRAIARVPLQQLAESTSCSAWLFLENRDDAVAVLAVQPGPFQNSSRFVEGSRHPLQRGSAGYALLSLRPAAPDDLPQVVTARELGYAMSRGEITPSAWGLAAPVPLIDNAVRACVNLAGSSEQQLMDATPALMATVVDIAHLVQSDQS